MKACENDEILKKDNNLFIFWKSKWFKDVSSSHFSKLENNLNARPSGASGQDWTSPSDLAGRIKKWLNAWEKL